MDHADDRGGRRKILLVEDEAIVALAEKRVLEENGYQVLRAGSGEEAVELALGDSSIDLILMDIDLGAGLDGTQVARRILAERSLPIVFLTSHREKEMVDRVKGITRYGYVLKASGEFVLLESIAMAFELFEAHRQITENEHWLRTIIDALPDEFWAVDRNRVYVMQNAESRRRVGPLVGRAAEEADVPEETQRLWQANERRVFRGERVRTEHRYFSDGEERFGESNLVPLEFDGSITHVLGLTRDITSQKRAEEYLRSRENFLDKLIETSPVGIVVLNTGGAITFANEQAESILGLSRNEIEQRRYDAPEWIATDVEGRPLPTEEYPFNQVMESGRPVRDYRHAIRWPDGRRRYLSIDAAPMFDEDGRLQRVVAAVNDVTPEETTRLALEESEERYRRLFSEAPVGIFLSTSSGRPLDANPAMARLLGCESPEEALERYHDLSRQLYVDPKRRAQFVREISERGEVEGFVYQARRKDGSTVWISMNARISERHEDGSFVIGGYAVEAPPPA